LIGPYREQKDWFRQAGQYGVLDGNKSSTKQQDLSQTQEYRFFLDKE
jgi:hypothetical protein